MKPKISIKILLAIAFIVISNVSDIYAQEIIKLKPRETRDRINGNLIMTGNSIVGLDQVGSTDHDPNADYNGNASNGNSISDYIDIDGDSNTFSSSSANIITPRPDCTEIVYAGLYWSATYYLERKPVNFLNLEINNTSIAGDYETGYLYNSPTIPAGGITRNLVLVDDNSGFDTADACSPIFNWPQVNGNIAVVRRGTCNFSDKVFYAQQAGAIAVILVNNVPGFSPGPFLNPGFLTIPSIRVSQADGNAIIAQMFSNTVNATLETRVDTTIGDEELNGLPINDARKQGAADFRNIKFKVPGGSYVDITADQTIYDGYRGTPTNVLPIGIDPTDPSATPNPQATDDVPYVCYSNVTSLINQNATNGEYTVANMNATIGQTSGQSGASGGWTLVIIYEDPLESSKYISTNDGFVQINSGSAAVDFTYTGFTTLPGTLPVKARYGVAALEGDRGLGGTVSRPNGDQLLILNAAKPTPAFVPLGEDISTPANNFDINPTINFFNSSVTFNHQYITNRNPASENTLGFDIDLFDLPNTNNVLIDNDQDNVTFRLATDSDTYRVFLNTFSVEIIEPELRVIKRVYETTDANGNGVLDEITNANVELGNELFYDLEIENVGNEDLIDGSITITDTLPDNVDLVNIETLPPGVTSTITPPSRIDFAIPASLVEQTDAPIFIRFKVKLVDTCEKLRDACSNRIQNSATATFTGAISKGNPSTTNSSSIIGACGNTDGEATNFLVNIPACESNSIFCDDDFQLTAGTGYNQYTWSGPGIAGTIVETDNVFDFSDYSITPGTGIYTVVKEDTSGVCMSLTETFDVKPFRNIENPILDYVNNSTVISTNCSGLELPQILLCGTSTMFLDSKFLPAEYDSISWQKLSPSGSCILDPNDACSLLSGNCTDSNWVEQTGGDTPTFTVSEAGDYRIFVEFKGGCTRPFYFSVFKNDYQPTLTMTPIECGNDGSVTVTNAPTNFAFSLTSGAPTFDVAHYTNTTGVFPIDAASAGGTITVYGIDTTFPGCEYSAMIDVPKINPTFELIGTNPTCTNDDNNTGTGSIQIRVTNGSPQFQYTITGGTLPEPIVVPNSGANNGNYIQENLLPGTYDVEVISNRPAPECIYTTAIVGDGIDPIVIAPAQDFRAEAVVIAPETCTAGTLVQINVLAGSGNYLYDDGSGTFQANNVFEIPRPANPATEYTFYVTDNSLPAGTAACTIEVKINGITPYQPIVIDNVTVTQPACSGDNGQVRVQVSPEVAGRTYTYRLLNTTDQDPSPVYTVVDEIVSTSRDITFTNIPDLTSYRVRVLHNDTALPVNPASPPICMVEGTDFPISTPDAITADVTTERELSCNTPPDNTAIILIKDVVGGSGNYEWSFDATTNYTDITSSETRIPVSGSGGYTIYIRNRDTDDCVENFTTSVAVLEQVTDITFTADPTTSSCSAQTIAVTAVAEPVGPTYTYSVTPAPVSGDASTGVFVLNRNVDYNFTATRGDNQCALSLNHREELLPIINIIDATEINAVTCKAGNDGAFTFNVGNSSSFRYTVTGPLPDTTTIVASGSSTTSSVTIQSPATPLVVGTYTITVVDASLAGNSPPNCTDSTTVTITEPAVALDFGFTTKNSDCNADTGVITVNAIGGRGNFQYELRDNTNTVVNGYQYPNTNNEFTGLADGNYTILVRDGNSSNACQVTKPATIEPFTGPVIVLATGGDVCVDTNPATQRITITPSTTTTTTGPFEYILNGATNVPVTFLAAPDDDTFEIPNLTAGNYTVTVLNTETNCTSNVVNFTIDPELTITASLAKDIDCNSGATITYIPGGGNGVGRQFNLYNPPVPPSITPTLVQSNIPSPYSDAAVLVPGDYIVEVTEASGCNAFSNTITITTYTALTATNPAVVTEPTCPGETGSIDVEVTAGKGPFTYVLDGDLTTQIGPTVDTTVTFPNVTAGGHTVTITDGSGATPACTLDVTATLTDPDPIVPTITQTTLSCIPGSEDAIITITGITGGSGNYAYTLDPTAGYTNITVFPVPLPAITVAGDYTIYIANQGTPETCAVTRVITIDEKLEVESVTVTPTPTGLDCINETVDVVVSASSVGPPPTYQYSITPDPATGAAATGSTAFSGTTNYTFTNGVTYRVTARRNDSECTNFEDFNQSPIDKIEITNATQTQPVTCKGDNDGAFNFTVDTTAFPNFTFEVIGPAPSVAVVATGTFPGDALAATGLENGQYTIRVTDTNASVATNCTTTETVDIAEPATDITFNDNVNQTCTDNTVSVNTVAGGNGAEYTYELFNSSDVSQGAAIPITQTYTGVANGNGYYIIVRDSKLCETRGTPFNITPLPTVGLSVTSSELCLDDNVATIDFAITSGSPDYSYTITRDGTQIASTPLGAGVTTFTTPNLTQSGTYIITVTDNVGCTASFTQVIAPKVSIQASLSRDLTCLANAEIAITTSGGNGATSLQISIDGAAFTNYTGAIPFITPTAATYQFKVIDSQGCFADSAVIRVNPAPNPVATVTPTDISCNGDSTGIITFAIDNTVGTAPYTTSIDNGGTFSSRTVYSGLTGGIYDYIVRDAKGCDLTGRVTINEPDAITATFTESFVTCTGGGTFDFADINVTGVTGGTITATGYTYKIYDSSTGNLVVPDLTNNPSDPPLTSGNTITTTSTSVLFEELSFGTYYITIEDEKKCLFRSDPITISSPVDDIDINAIPVASDCNANGAVYDIIIREGTRPYEIRIVDVPGFDTFISTNGTIHGSTPIPPAPFVLDATPGGNVHQYTGLTFDIPYIIEVKDVGGCIYREAIAAVPSPNGVTAVINGDPTDISCNGLTNGTVNFTFDGYTGNDVQWEIFNSSSGIPIGSGSASPGPAPYTDNLGSFDVGSYLVVFSTPTAQFCGASIEFNIEEPSVLGIELVSSKDALCAINGSPRPGEIVVIGRGGTSPYTYDVSPTGTFTNTTGTFELAAGSHDIYVRDANGCVEGPINETINNTTTPSFTNLPIQFVVDPCNYDNDYTFTVNASGGVGDLEYGIDDGDPGTADVPSYTADSPSDGIFTFRVFGAGEYNFFVRDANGCTDTGTITVYDPLTLAPTFSGIPNCTAADGEITANVTGTIAGTLSYELQNSAGVDTGNTTGLTTGIFTGVAPGSYIVEVTDSGRGPTGCSFKESVSIQAPPPPTIDGTTGATNMTCINDAPPTGSITVSLTGALDPTVTYEYEITTAPITSDTRARQSNPTFNNLDVDNYTVRVWATFTNGSGASAQDVVCFDDHIFNITEPPVVSSDPPVQGDHFDCDGANTNATIEITGVTGGSNSGYTATVTRPDGVVLSDIAIIPSPAITIVEAPIPGNYTVQIFDSNDCPSTISNVPIAAYTKMFDPLVTQTQPISCRPSPAGDEIVEVSIQGGSGDFLFERVDNLGTVLDAIDTPSGTRIAQFFNLTTVATHTFRITDQGDANGMGLNCTIPVTYKVDDFDTIEATIAKGPATIQCFGANTANVILDVTGHTGPYNYTVTNLTTGDTDTGSGDTTIGSTTIGTLRSGNIQVTVTDPITNCNDESNIVNITQPDQLILNPIVSNINANCNEDAKVRFTAIGGTGAYTFTATNVPVGGTVTQTNATGTFSLPFSTTAAENEYTISVVDANSCTSTPVSRNVTINMTAAPTLAPLTFVDDPCDYTDNSNIIRATGTTNVVGGTGVLTFQITNMTTGVVSNRVPGSGGLTHDFTVTSPAIYEVRVFDENGCPSNDRQIRVFPKLSVTADFTGDPTCRLTDGTITATPTGGSDFIANPGNFTFTLINNVTNAIVLGPQASNIFTPVAAGDYRVEVTDSNVLPLTGSGCTKSGNVTELTVPLDPVLSEDSDDVSCIGASDGAVTVAIQTGTDLDGPYTYQLFENDPAIAGVQQIGADQESNPTFTGLSFNALPAPHPTGGQYLVVVTSNRGCSSSIPVQINEPSAVTADAPTLGDAFKCGANATINIANIAGGTGANYTVRITEPAPSSITRTVVVPSPVPNPFVVDAPIPGLYTIEIVDGNSCTNATPLVVTVPPLSEMTNETVNVTIPISCLTANTETVTVSVDHSATNTAGFEFDLLPLGGADVQTIAGGPAGTVTSNPFALTGAVGTTYTFQIKDLDTDCTVRVSHKVEAFDLAKVTAVQQAPETCFGSENGSVQIGVSGYIGDFGYTIVDVGVTPEAIVYTSTADLTTDGDLATADSFIIPLAPAGIGVGTYRVDIIERSAPNCPSSSDVFTIDGPTIEFDATITEINVQETCAPGTDISFQTSVTGARGVVTYLLVETGATSSTGLFTGLSIAQASPVVPATVPPTFTFTVTATDTFGAIVCTDDAVVTVRPPSNDVAITPIPPSSISCFGEEDGRITVIATGTDTPLRYSITPAATGVESVLQTGTIFELLKPDSYLVKVYDKLNCTAQTTAVINDVAEVTVNLGTVTPVTCSTSTRDVTVNGTSSVAIRDHVMVNVTDSDPANHTETVVTTNTASHTFTGLTQGEYVFYVVDVNGCRSKRSNPVPVIPITAINFDLDTSAAQVNCRDEATGVINIMNLTGGVGSYEFLLLTGTSVLPIPAAPANLLRGPQATTEFRLLPPGDYTYVARSVTDISCTAIRTFTIINPPLFEPTVSFTDVSCSGEDDGTITIDAAGGTPPYSFAIDSQPGVFFNDASDGVPNQHMFTNLEPGIYTVLAQDSRGCDEVFTITINEPNTLVANIVGTVTPETCFEAVDGAVTIEVSGGTPPYRTSITNNPADFVQDMFTYTSLPGGTTTIYIMDANDCIRELPVEIPGGVVLNAILTPTLVCPVRDVNDPSVILEAPKYIIEFELGLNSVKNDIIFTLNGINGTPDPASNTSISANAKYEVTPGDYQGILEHSGGCTVITDVIRIEEYIPLSVPVAEMTGNTQDPNEYQIIESGGRRFNKEPFYAFSYAILRDGRTVNQLQSDDFTELEGNIFTVRETADYALRVVDADGCEVRVVQNITYINIRIPNYFTPDSPNSTVEEQFWYPRQITPNLNDPFFFENMEVMIFDRYGRMLVEFKGNQQGWDGLYQGKQLPSGDYWYTIILNDIDNREFTGHFTLYR